MRLARRPCMVLFAERTTMGPTGAYGLPLNQALMLLARCFPGSPDESPHCSRLLLIAGCGQRIMFWVMVRVMGVSRCCSLFFFFSFYSSRTCLLHADVRCTVPVFVFPSPTPDRQPPPPPQPQPPPATATATSPSNRNRNRNRNRNCNRNRNSSRN